MVVHVQPIAAVAVVVPTPSPTSTPAGQIPSPAGLTATAITSSLVSLFWQPQEGVAAYNVYRKKLSETEFKLIAQKAANVYRDTNINLGDGGYVYSLQSYTADGKYSAFSPPSTLPTVIFPIDPNDSDGDGFSNSLERFLGTDPARACGENAWPVDFKYDKKVNIGDVNSFIPSFNSKIGGAGYSKRFDLNADGQINMDDINVLKDYFHKSCP